MRRRVTSWASRGRVSQTVLWHNVRWGAEIVGWRALALAARRRTVLFAGAARRRLGAAALAAVSAAAGRSVVQRALVVE